MVYRFFKRLKHTLYPCNQNYYATRCRVKALPIMKELRDWDFLIYVYHILDKLFNLN